MTAPLTPGLFVTFILNSGESVEVTAKDWTARVMQHELDHLGGTLISGKQGRIQGVGAMVAPQLS